MSILIDLEFKALIPPLAPDEYTQLEKNILKDGIRDALVVWPQPNGDSILIDGHNRWNIAAAHAGIRFDVKRMEFKSRDEAMQWIILNQFGRRNLSAYDRGILALKLKPVIAEQVRKKETDRKTTYQKSEKSSMPTRDTTKELAALAGVSHDTIHKVETIANSPDESLREQVRAGEVSINKAYTEIKRREREKLPTAAEHREKVEERHETVKNKTVVSLAEAKQDHNDREFLANETRRDITKTLGTIHNLFLLVADGRINTKNLNSEGREHVLAEIAAAINELELLAKKIEGGERNQTEI